MNNNGNGLWLVAYKVYGKASMDTTPQPICRQKYVLYNLGRNGSEEFAMNKFESDKKSLLEKMDKTCFKNMEIKLDSIFLERGDITKVQVSR